MCKQVEEYLKIMIGEYIREDAEKSIGLIEWAGDRLTEELAEQSPDLQRGRAYEAMCELRGDSV